MKEEILEQTVTNGQLNRSRKGLDFKRYYTQEGLPPFDAVEWEFRTAAITSESGEVIFEQKNVEVPKTWSMTATNIVASKYFHGKRGTPGAGNQRAAIDRPRGARRFTDGAFRAAISHSHESAEVFQDELTHLLVNQMMAFNSPVWFNCGVEAKPQCSACFINSVQDTMGSILDLAKTEGMLFKWGSGTGSNLSPIRSSKETLVGWRHRLRPGVLHEGIRRVCRRHQVRRQDAACGKDGDPQRRPSGHRRIHQLQGE